ncbi:MAG: hypothetical protein HZB11_02905 [Candidatus Yonathbacteria bacterium]|nr:hypothetical protein [Candidatus Yonathbacteria bacterium]
MTSNIFKIRNIRQIVVRIRKRLSSWEILNFLLLLIIKIKEARENSFYTIHRRPQKSSGISTYVIKYKEKQNTAIVMHGQIITKNNFTLETASLYKKNFPNTILILSTWLNEDKKTIQKIRQVGWTVVQNEKPSYSGYYNINYQLTSSSNGIQAAKKSGAEYVLKTRTDQRIYNPNAIRLLHSFSKLYPPNKDSQQAKRLIIPNIDTFKYRPYGIGDMIMFGHIDDMLLYWGTEHDMRSAPLNRYPTVIEDAQAKTSEVYLCTEYMKKLKQPLIWTIDNSWKVFGKYFCIFDYSLLDMFWYKYKVHEEYRSHYYNSTHSLQIMQYYEWISCYENTYNPNSLPEEILNVKIGDSLPKR